MGNLAESVIEALKTAFVYIVAPAAFAVVCYGTGRLCATFLTPGIRTPPFRRAVAPPQAKRVKPHWHGFTYERDGERVYSHKGLAAIGVLIWITTMIIWKLLHKGRV